MDYIIDAEFQARNRPQTKAEREGLERMIERDGCAAGALVVAQIEGDTEKRLIDGHSTREICLAKGLPMTEPRRLPFPDRQAVLEWIDMKQRGRRNLTPKELAARHKARVQRVAKARRQGKSTRVIAKEEGVSQPQVVADIKEAGDKGLSPEPRRGKVSGTDNKEYSSSRSAGLDRLKARGLVGAPSAPPPPKPQAASDWPGRERAQGLVHAIKAVFQELQDAEEAGEKPWKTALEKQQKKLALIVADVDLMLGKAQPASGKFVKPTVEEVAAYCKERGNAVNAETFVDFYESKGWKVGTAAMKDWRASVRTWEKNNHGKGSSHGRVSRVEAPAGKYANVGVKVQA